MPRSVSNVAASVHQRLLNVARQTNRPFNELLQYFAMERFLYRLSRSPHADKFVLKGALMFVVWRAPVSRPTMDIDLLGFVESRIDFIVTVTKEICMQKVDPDGLLFDPESVQGERIAEDADYQGVRIRFRGSLGTARITMQLDVGFGDVVVPRPTMAAYPTILSFPAPQLRGYSRESAVAEKLEAMVKLGVLNSRMKDFYDIWFLARQFDFDGRILTKAILKTFATRGTEIHPEPVALTQEFALEPGKQMQWQGFIRKNRLENVPKNLAEVLAELGTFLGPITKALAADQTFKGNWKAPGPWR